MGSRQGNGTGGCASFWARFAATLGVVAAFAASPAGAQLVENGDILWETEWDTFATALGQNPAEYDFQSNGVREAWEFAFAEVIITSPAAPAHYAGMVDIYNENLATLTSENPNLAAQYGALIVLAICRGGIADVDNFSKDPSLVPGATWTSVDLTDGLYRDIREVLRERDADGDGISNETEGGADQLAYVTRATTSQKGYRLAVDEQVDLLPDSFYNNGQRAAFWGSLNNAGTKVAFWGVDYPAGADSEIYIVNLADVKTDRNLDWPWQKLTSNISGTPDSSIAWSPDDSKLFVRSYVVDVATGTATQELNFNQYLNDPVIGADDTGAYILTRRNAGPVIDSSGTFPHMFEIDFIRACDGSLLAGDCVGGPVAYEFDVDAEGWAAANHVSNLTVTGGVLTGEIVDLDPYIDGPGITLDAATNPYVVVSIKQTVASAVELFWTRADSPGQDGFKKAAVLNPGPAGQFNTVVFDLSAHPEWTGTITSLRVDPQQNFSFDNDISTSNLIALPILDNGDPDLGRTPVYLTNFVESDFPNGGIDWTEVSPDFNRIAFVDWRQSVPNTTDLGDLYVIDNVRQILAAPRTPFGEFEVSTLAPTSLEEGYGTRLYVSDIVAQSPSFSQDGSLLLFGQDTSNLFQAADFLGTLAVGDWDVGVTRAAGNSQSFILNAPGNQAVPIATRGGTRLLYMNQGSGGGLDLHLFATGLEVCNLVLTTPVAENVDIDGENYDQVLVEEEQSADDASGTQIVLPPNTTISFPDPSGTSSGSDQQEITIETPVETVTQDAIPTDPGTGEPVADAIPVVRQFGPSGTRFEPAIAVTIAYKDEELAALGITNEAALKLFLFNESNQKWDIEVVENANPQPTDLRWIESRDTVNSTITFRTRTFSKFGIGGSADTDADGIPNSSDPDDDNDGVNDGSDANPLDTDNDGVDNIDDFDDDGDGISDSIDPNLLDTDNDGDPNVSDPDDDADGILDISDAFLLDTDNDGQNNEADTDDDGDGIADSVEGTGDTDNDGIANNIDTDADGDGILDSVEGTDDSDGDGTPDYLDDSAGIPTVPVGSPVGSAAALGLTMAALALAAATRLRRKR